MLKHFFTINALKYFVVKMLKQITNKTFLIQELHPQIKVQITIKMLETVPTVKHGEGSIMVRDCLTLTTDAKFYRVVGIVATVWHNSVL